MKALKNKFPAWCLMSLFSLISMALTAQGVAVNAAGNPADPSAVFDASSTTQGILVPRMTESDKNTIQTPANGLLVYQTDGANPGFWYFNGTLWVQAIGPAGPAGPAGASAGSNPITHVSAASAGQVSWLQCYQDCFNLSAVAVSPVDGIIYSDWRMPSSAEAVYYRSTFTAPAGGWLGSNMSQYIWSTDQQSQFENGWSTISESGNWNGNVNNTAMRCRCVR